MNVWHFLEFWILAIWFLILPDSWYSRLWLFGILTYSEIHFIGTRFWLFWICDLDIRDITDRDFGLFGISTHSAFRLSGFCHLRDFVYSDFWPSLEFLAFGILGIYYFDPFWISAFWDFGYPGFRRFRNFDIGILAFRIWPFAMLVFSGFWPIRDFGYSGFRAPFSIFVLEICPLWDFYIWVFRFRNFDQDPLDHLLRNSRAVWMSRDGNTRTL